MNITKLKQHIGVLIAWLNTGIDQYLHGNSPGKSRFILKEPPLSSKKIHTNEYIEERTNCLILKNIYIDMDRPIPSNNIERLKATKYFSSIQRDATKKHLLTSLQNLYILPEGEIQAAQTHENLCFIETPTYLISFLIWRLQYLYIQCQLSDIDFNTISILFSKKLNIPLQKFYIDVFKNTVPDEAKGIHLFKQYLIYKPYPNTSHLQSRFISKHIARKFRTSILHSFGIKPPLPVQQAKKITLVLRKDYKTRLDRPGLKIVGRKIINEEKFIATLKRHLPNDVELQAFEFGQLTIKDQLNIIANTDILLAVHGSVLAYNVFLPDNAGVFEIIPANRDLKHWYTNTYTLAVNRGLFYKRHIHLNISDDHQYHLINLPANKIAKKLTALINTINSANI